VCMWSYLFPQCAVVALQCLHLLLQVLQLLAQSYTGILLRLKQVTWRGWGGGVGGGGGAGGAQDMRGKGQDDEQPTTIQQACSQAPKDIFPRSAVLACHGCRGQIRSLTSLCCSTLSCAARWGQSACCAVAW
jgi:hypothetical protein